MTLSSIEGAPGFNFSLIPPKSELDEGQTLTIAWRGRSVSLHCLKVEDLSRRSQEAASAPLAIASSEGLIPLSLNPQFTAYIKKPSEQEGVTYVDTIQFLQSLQNWIHEDYLPPSEKSARNSAETKILDFIKDGRSDLDLSALGDFSRLPEVFSNLEKIKPIRTLKLSHNQLSSLPESLGQLQTLEELVLSYDRYFISLPESLGQLQNLKKLVLSNNQLSLLPESLGLLQTLRELDLSYNKITELPKSFGQLKDLEYLELPGNKITKLPENFGQLKDLEYLDFTKNQFTELPESIGLLQALRKLILSENQLTELPESLGKLKNLQELHLSENQLTRLPESLGQLKYLQILSLWGNQFSELPDSLWQLQALQELDLSNNQLSSLPENFGQLQNLSFLEIKDNPLRSLPLSILNLPSHLEIELSGHNLSETTLNHLRQLLEERRAQNLPTPRFSFDMPPPRNSSNPQALEISIN